MYTRKPFLIFISFLFFVAFFCSNGQSRQQTYRVGIYQNEPYVYTDSAGKEQGICVDVIEEIAAKEGWKIEYVKDSWPRIYEKIKTGKIDILLAVAYVKEREKELVFTSENQIITWAQIFTRKGSGIKSKIDLAGKVIAVQEDDIYAENIEEDLDGFGLKCEFILCADYKDVFRKLESEEADAGVVDRIFRRRYLLARDIDETAIIFSPIEVRFALKKEDSQTLKRTIDRYIGEMTRDKESVLNQSIDRHMAMGERGRFRRNRIISGICASLILLLVSVILFFVRKAGKNRKALLKTSDQLVMESRSRRKAEEALGDSVERYKQIFEYSPAGIVILGLDGTLVDANAVAADLVGVSREDSIGKNICDFPSLREQASFIRKKIEEAVDLGRLEPFEMEIVPENETKSRIISIHASTIEQGGEILILALFSDATQKKMLENQMLHMQKMESIGTLAGGIAHDFNNILTGILGYANMLKINHHDNKEVFKAADVIEKGAERAAMLTSQLVGFAREGKHLVQPVDMHRVIDAVLGRLEKAVDRKIRMERKFMADRPFVSGDPDQLEQVILNLSLNARDAMPSGGKLLIRTENIDLGDSPPEKGSDGPSGKMLMIEMEDTGQGIPKYIQDRIFDPLYSTKRKVRGGGMGLAMVYGIVINHGGSISVESEEGLGSSFRILLPVEESANKDARETDTIIPFIGKGRIMIVDDDEVVLNVVQGMLEKLGYGVEVCQDSLKAIDLYKENHHEIDLVIIDMIMPGMDGEELYRKLKDINPDIKTILSSGFILDERIQKLLDEGMNGFLQKPFVVTQFSRLVAKVLDLC
ncbi:MAG: transporter substrate-binding domain-containing protein [Candidatus Krumholzibacteriota bacterium]|nr:transporter substrate-binding domain-containing protein [Candidatus Krumholzibacteriota bacterium]